MRSASLGGRDSAGLGAGSSGRCGLPITHRPISVSFSYQNHCATRVMRGRVCRHRRQGPRLRGDDELLSPGALDVETLRETWRQHSLAAGWAAADDWHTAAVDAVAEAVFFREEPSPRTPAASRGPAADPGRACGSPGPARARAGVGIAIPTPAPAALYPVLGRGTPPLHLVSSV